MELKYKQALEEHDLSISELPEDAKIGITNINDVLKGISMLEKKGKQPSQQTYNKLRAMDKWVYYEILDYLNDTDKNEEEIPYESDDVLEDFEEEDDDDETPKVDNTGLLVEADLEKMYKTGKKEWAIDEIKSSSNLIFDIVFDNFDEDEENGVETNKYKLIETDEEIFTLTKK
jgi:hypothetical protein